MSDSKRGRGRPKNTKQKNNNNNESTTPAFVPKIMIIDPEIPQQPKRSKKSALDQLAESHDPLLLTPERQTELISEFGFTFANKMFEFCNHDSHLVDAWCVCIRDFLSKRENQGIPENIFTDFYWDMSEEDKISMLNEAFELQDDDADLDKVQEGEFRCSKCGCRRILVRLRQIRSSDEAMTQFLKCANKDCKKSWVIN